MVFGSFWGAPDLENSIKTIGFSMVFVDFYKIDIFKKSCKKGPSWLHFGKPKPWKINEKSCLKPWLFATPIFSRFFAIFIDFGTILGGPGGSKNWEKSQKIAFGARSDHDCSWETILIAILKQFFQILDEFGRIPWYFGEDFWMIFNDCKRFRLQSLIWWLGRRGADQ